MTSRRKFIGSTPGAHSSNTWHDQQGHRIA